MWRLMEETAGMRLSRFLAKETLGKRCWKICRKTTMDRVFETTLLETNFLVIYPYVTQMEASKSQNCCVVTGRKLSFKGKISYKRLRVLSFDCILITIIIIMIIIIIISLFSNSIKWFFICKIQLLKNISTKKIQICYFYQKEIHLLKNKVKKYRRGKISILI